MSIIIIIITGIHKAAVCHDHVPKYALIKLMQYSFIIIIMFMLILR